jgi:hypothetical protein
MDTNKPSTPEDMIYSLKVALYGYLADHGWEGPNCTCDLCHNGREAIKQAGGMPDVRF